MGHWRIKRKLYTDFEDPSYVTHFWNFILLQFLAILAVLSSILLHFRPIKLWPSAWVLWLSRISLFLHGLGVLSVEKVCYYAPSHINSQYSYLLSRLQPPHFMPAFSHSPVPLKSCSLYFVQVYNSYLRVG